MKHPAPRLLPANSRAHSRSNGHHLRHGQRRRPGGAIDPIGGSPRSTRGPACAGPGCYRKSWDHQWPSAGPASDTARLRSAPVLANPCTARQAPHVGAANQAPITRYGCATAAEGAGLRWVVTGAELPAVAGAAIRAAVAPVAIARARVASVNADAAALPFPRTDARPTRRAGAAGAADEAAATGMLGPRRAAATLVGAVVGGGRSARAKRGGKDGRGSRQP